MTTAYERYQAALREEEDSFRRHSTEYVYQSGWCAETGPYGVCGRSAPHFTHEARGAAGNVLGRWRVRKVIEKVDPLIQLPE